MPGDTFETLSGVKVVALVFGCIGALLGISYSPPMSKQTAFAAIIAGIVCGGLGPQLLSWAFGWHLPVVADNAIAFISGVMGMFIVPGILVVGRNIAADPWSVIDRLRGIAKRDDTPKGDGK